MIGSFINQISNFTRPSKEKESEQDSPTNPPISKAALALDQVKSDLKPKKTLIGVWGFLIINLLLTGGLYLIELTALLQISKIANKPPATLVEKSDGTGMAVTPIASFERTDTAILQFVSEVVQNLFIATPLAYEEGSEEKAVGFDKGVEVTKAEGKGENLVTKRQYATVLAAFEKEFGEAFLEKLAEVTPKGVFNGTTQTMLRIDELIGPEKVKGKEGEWKVTVFGRLVEFSSRSRNPDQAGNADSFIKEVFVKAIPPQEVPVEEGLEEMQKKVNRLTKIGLVVTNIQNVEIKTTEK